MFLNGFSIIAKRREKSIYFFGSFIEVLLLLVNIKITIFAFVVLFYVLCSCRFIRTKIKIICHFKRGS